MIIVVTGGPGVGKTTVSKCISLILDIDFISTDTVRKILFKEKIFTPESRTKVYEGIYNVLERMLANDYSIILDGSFSSPKYWKPILEKAKTYDDEMFHIRVISSQSIAKNRIKSRRNTFSDATVEITDNFDYSINNKKPVEADYYYPFINVNIHNLKNNYHNNQEFLSLVSKIKSVL